MDQSKKSNISALNEITTKPSTNVTLAPVHSNHTMNNTIVDAVWSWIPNNLNEELYIQVYTTLIICGVVLTVWRSIFFYKICMKSSEKLHNLMFMNIMQAKMKFYDTTTSGMKKIFWIQCLFWWELEENFSFNPKHSRKLLNLAKRGEYWMKESVLLLFDSSY